MNIVARGSNLVIRLRNVTLHCDFQRTILSSPWSCDFQEGGPVSVLLSTLVPGRS